MAECMIRWCSEKELHKEIQDGQHSVWKQALSKNEIHAVVLKIFVRKVLCYGAESWLGESRLSTD